MASAVVSRNTPISSNIRPSSSSHAKRKKDHARTEIWSNLLRQTREAQSQNRSQHIQTRDLVLCGGTPDDQRAFLERYVCRPPPAQPLGRNQQQRPQRPKGELRLSNKFAIGYGHVTLFSPPSTSGGYGSGAGSGLGGEAEEVARVDIHTVPSSSTEYVESLRRLLKPKKERKDSEVDGDDVKDVTLNELDVAEEDGRRPSVCILMNWEEPWTFLDQLSSWVRILSLALVSSSAPSNATPLEVLKEFALDVTVVLQHVEAQESLLREKYTEEDFDYISQCVRTALLPINAALIYIPSAPPPPQPPGSPLSEIAKVLYTALGLDVASLQAKTANKKEELQPKHNVVDRMAIVVPRGWDSVGKIRLLSETFSPEAVMEGWNANLSQPVIASSPPRPLEESSQQPETHHDAPEREEEEVFTTNGASPMAFSPQPSPPMSPSKAPRSAIADYERNIVNPQAHKASKPPTIEVTTKPEQEFLGEMRSALVHFDQEDAQGDRQKSAQLSTANTANAFRSSSHGPAGESEGALSELGDVSFNVGGVNYNTASAEAAIERLRRPQPGSSSGADSPSVSGSRAGTPRPPRREGKEETPSGKGDIPTEKLEEYFKSLMKRGGGGSQSSTPSKH